MKKMHYNTQCNNLIQREINNKSTENCIPSNTDGDINDNSESSLTFEVNAKNRQIIKKHNGETDIGTYKGTTTSCTSSTDSGVNISDNDEIPPSPTSSYLHSFPSSTSSSSGTATLNLLNKQYHKTYKNSNRDNNKNNDYNNHIFNVNNDNEADDDDDDDDNINNSKDFDNKLKIEQHRKRQQQQKQQFLNVQYNSNECNNTQPNQNIIESENEINHQRNLTTATPTVIVTNTKPNNKNTNTTTTTLQHNEFNNRPQRSPSISSSLSLSSTNTNIYEHNPPPNMHHCNGSPVVSIRSINSSTIVTSDSDSDADLNGDIEGVHDDYVIKKLGTQVSYPPNHPNIPKINNGQTILNQKIVPGDDQVLTSPLALLAAVGDNIGAAQALGPVPSFSAVPQRPQIGSIALSNSSDVTFGDKHFYEGPVTIQQFLIDSRDKFKETNGKDNPTFVNNNETTNDAKDINSSPVQSGKRKKLIILGVLSAIAALLIVAAVLGSLALNDSKTQDNVGGGYILRIVPRDGWLAQPSINDLIPLKHPIHRVIVIPTRTSECETQAACTYTVRITQTFNIESQQQDDIIYNFLIGGDGNVYEGRGWNFKGSVVKGFNDDSISFAYIGSFKKQPPNYKQLNVTKLLLEEGVRLNKLSSNYRLVGANKLDPTSVTTLADALYKSFENWPHWSDN